MRGRHLELFRADRLHRYAARLEDFADLMMMRSLMPVLVRHCQSLSRCASLALAVGLLAGCATRPQARIALAPFSATQRAQAEHNLAVFNAVWDLVHRKHYEPKTHGVNWEQAAATFGVRAAAAPDESTLYTVLNEMLASLEDSHTHALPPAYVAERHSRERARSGFGMTRLEEQWVVSDVMANSPAAAAGVMPGWVVVRRNGQPLGRRPDFHPREGEDIQWEFLDANDRSIALTLKAQRLSTAPQQVVRELPGGFVYLRFDEFDVTDRRWLSRQLLAHASAPGVIVDLRHNPGGETFSLGISIGEFFDHAVDCGTFITRTGARAVKNSWQIGSAKYRGRVVVLVDGNSASAAEIFAAVLKDHRRATIVGRKTAGAVLASWFYRLPDGGELQLSRQDYMAPNGRRIEGNGVEPDVVVTRSLTDIRLGHDQDVEVALRVLREAK